jgi:hypothetical protein
MFGQKEVAALKVGDVVVVGSTITEGEKTRFIKTETFGEKITVERIWEEAPGKTRIDLTCAHGKSRVYAHDEGKRWHRVSNFN